MNDIIEDLNVSNRWYNNDSTYVRDSLDDKQSHAAKWGGICVICIYIL
jgi:hypothetical protein